METIEKGFKEWNAVVEALGKGIQTIVIRKPKTHNELFLLYPTIFYATKDNFLVNFQKKYRNFVSDNALPKKMNNKTEIKYFAKVHQIIEASKPSIKRLKDYYIWDPRHIESYLEKTGNIWILRVYELESPVMVTRKNGITFSNISEKLTTAGSKQVLSDKEFKKTVKEIEGIAVKV